jgi:NADPH-dependent curcumin reductase CurA
VRREGLTELGGLLAAGAITARLTAIESLADAAALLDRLRHGRVHGKAIIRT